MAGLMAPGLQQATDQPDDKPCCERLDSCLVNLDSFQVFQIPLEVMMKHQR